MKYIFSLIVVSIISLSAYANPGGVSGTVNMINIKETGYILITFDDPHSNPMGCELANMVAIEQSHVAKKEILSVVLAAHTVHKRVGFWITGCYEQYGTSFPIGGTAAIFQE